MATDRGYETRRHAVQTYFDRTAADAWKAMTSDVPVSGIRATVRAGRKAMADAILQRLPADLSGRRILDAGCGTGTLSVELARRGAAVVAVDLSETLVEHARRHVAAASGELAHRIEFHAGDMLSPAFGRFDHVVIMDCLIHYEAAQAIAALDQLAWRTTRSILFTTAPKTPLLSVMHRAGKLFPRADRSPAIVPIGRGRLEHGIAALLPNASIAGHHRVNTAFYKSRLTELVLS